MKHLIKRGTSIPTEADLEDYQLGWCTGNKKLYIKDDGVIRHFMTTSCCAGYNELIRKHLPEIKPYVSTTGTPTYYISEIIKKEMPDAVTVFVSPCVAKRAEGFDNPNVDYVMNFEELGAMFIAHQIQIADCEEEEYVVESSKHARNFGFTGGVAESVKASLRDESIVNPCVINGLNKETIRQLKKYALAGECEGGCNLIEVMCCEGGCIGGNATVNNQKMAKKQLTPEQYKLYKLIYKNYYTNEEKYGKI